MTIVNLYDQNKRFSDNLIIIIWIISLSILSFSFYAELIEKIQPCHLCKLQRYIYISIILIAPLCQIQSINSLVRNIITLTFFVGFCLAVYHTLVLFNVITDRCTMTQKIDNVSDFMRMIEQPKISCENAKWKIFGIPASICNAIFSFWALISINFKKVKKLICLKI